MKWPKNQPFWTAMILHIVVLVALFLATIVEAFKPKEPPHVFEMIELPAQAPAAANPAAANPPPPEIPPLPELEPVPEVPPLPIPVARVPEPPAARPEPAPPQPRLMTMDDFIREHGRPQPRQTSRPAPQRPSVTLPRIDVPQLVLPANPSRTASETRPLTRQQMSALGSYSAQLRARIDAAWAKPADLAGGRIAATVYFDVSASGRISNIQLKPGSGNAAFDQSVLAAFRSISSGGPTPTGQGHRFSMTFRMTD